VFYRYLRDRFSRWPRWLGVGIAAFVSSAIFAAIHPQGLLAIFVLTTLAMGLALAREWRGSLYTSIAMHALNNSLITGLMLLVFRG
jgi:membrane protease YdiL (CAAX protease family)